MPDPKSEFDAGHQVAGRPKKMLNTSFYVVFLTCTVGVVVMCRLLPGSRGLQIFLYCLSHAAVILGQVVLLALMYKAWGTIKQSAARMSPAGAIGFLFVPFFNMYWYIQVFWGFAQDYNLHVAEQNLGARVAPAGLMLAYATLFGAAALTNILIRSAGGYESYGFVRGLGTMLLPVAMTLGVVVASEVCTCVNSLRQNTSVR